MLGAMREAWFGGTQAPQAQRSDPAANVLWWVYSGAMRVISRNVIHIMANQTRFEDTVLAPAVTFWKSLESRIFMLHNLKPS